MDKKKKIKDQMAGLKAYTDSVASKGNDKEMEMKKAVVLKRLRNGQAAKKKKKEEGY